VLREPKREPERARRCVGKINRHEDLAEHAGASVSPRLECWRYWKIYARLRLDTSPGRL
jgi:hypothetical protein